MRSSSHRPSPMRKVPTHIVAMKKICGSLVPKKTLVRAAGIAEPSLSQRGTKAL